MLTTVQETNPRFREQNELKRGWGNSRQRLLIPGNSDCMMKPNTGGRLLKSQREPTETRRGMTSNAEKSTAHLKAASLMQALSLRCARLFRR
mmetsp:Transcript_24092/g.36506  ORF Transcript_24092/g.36506 Transcript_24092/m.36506 type:complete len:92 (-) Transcript_24092:76-351(-)